jgi:hypothetical protein
MRVTVAPGIWMRRLRFTLGWGGFCIANAALYLAPQSLDEMAVGPGAGVSHGTRTDVLGVAKRPITALEATAGIEPA